MASVAEEEGRTAEPVGRDPNLETARLNRRGAMEMPIEQVLEELLKRVEAGQVPKKQADTVKKLQERVRDGRGLSEMQEELLRDFAAEYGVC
jgi:hypothetical protein